MALNWRQEALPALAILAAFVGAYHLPVQSLPAFASQPGPIHEALQLLRWYAREHVLLCLIPAFYISGAIGVFIDKGVVLRTLGPQAPRVKAYGVASVSGGILAVCSCTVLPLFGGIYRRGAGLGPAAAFLYAGPAINVLAVVMTARILGAELGLARLLGALAFSLLVGLSMAWVFRREEAAPAGSGFADADEGPRVPAKAALALLLGLGLVLVFATLSPDPQAGSVYRALAGARAWLTAGAALGVAYSLWRWFGFMAPWLIATALATALAAGLPGGGFVAAFSVASLGLALAAQRGAGELGQDWLAASWDFAKQVLPLLLIGVLVAGLLLGRPGGQGLIPPEWIADAVGGNSVAANLAASLVGAFMYFATLTEVPILQGLLGAGMGQGPALSLLLAGPALSLPAMLVLLKIMGPRKTGAFVALVVFYSTVAGLLFGAWV
jgi:uncharacterized membrane protein YraQ (UPF0718 family)